MKCEKQFYRIARASKGNSQSVTSGRVLLGMLLLCLGLPVFSQTTNIQETQPSPAPLPRVAVFYEAGFPSVGGTPTLPPFKLVEVLALHGIRAQAFSAAELSEATNFNALRFTVLVLPYGNAFPEIAYENLNRFHKAGGCLVLNGLPFCHPCVKTNGQWKDLGQTNYFGYDADGIDTGGFGGPMEKERGARASVPGHPLGLNEGMLPSDTGNIQWLEPQSFAAGVQVLPLVNIGAGGEQHVGAALIRHPGTGLHGARDVWMGQVAGGGDESNRYFTEQLLLRGILWCQMEKGELNQYSFNTKLAALDRIRKPGPLPGNLPYLITPRMHRDTFLPKSKPPAQHLLVVKIDRLSRDERIALTCLQGLTSREMPQIWLKLDQEDQTWLDWHKEKGFIDSYEVVSNWPTLFSQFSNVFKGAIIPDPNLYRGDLLAVNIAECEDLIVATPELAVTLGLPIKVDLRGRFKTYSEGMRWVWANYKDRLNRHLGNYMNPPLLGNNCSFGYDFQWRSVVFWICGPVDEHQSGADLMAERRLMAGIFAEMDPNSVILGYPWGGDGVGLGEGDGVALASRYAKGLVATGLFRNASVMSGVRLEKLEQPKQSPAPPLDRNTIYIALVMSDGDNQNTWMGFFKNYFNQQDFGKFPLAFGMGPAIGELMPAVPLWYYEHASPQTEFIADVSGAAYTQPENYASAFADRERVYAGFLDWTARSMQFMGMQTVRTVSGEDEILARYAKALPFCHSLFADMGRYSGREGIDKLTYSLPDKTPIFRAVTTWKYGKEGLLREIREQTQTNRPAFVNGFVHCWTFSPEDLAHLYSQRDTNMVFVTPAQLATLYRQAKAKGWAK